MKIVVTLHGITTRGNWQKEINPWMFSTGWMHYPVDFDWYPKSLPDIAGFLGGHTRARLIDKFTRVYTEITHDAEYNKYSDHVVVIAHSFGTKIVADWLSKYDYLSPKFERFIFCGSIVGSHYDWGGHVRAGRIQGVLNEFGSQDFWTRLYSRIRRDDIAGVIGFAGSPPQIVNCERAFSHSDWFNRLHFNRVWKPYLQTGAPPLAPAPRPKSVAYT